jgi:rod shape-determining protein MreC
MTKRLILIISFFFVLLSYLFKDYIVEISLFINKSFVELKREVLLQLKIHFDQAHYINLLVKENRLLKDKVNNLEAKILACKDLKYFNYIPKPNLLFVYTISYASIPDFSQIYINYNKKIEKPKGLVYNNLVCGEVIKNIGNFSLAILNSNPKIRYSVYIGKKEIPGIFYGKINTIKFIPKFQDVKVGDMVITSGLDGIF